MPRYSCLIGLLCCVGCVGTAKLGADRGRHLPPAVAEEPGTGKVARTASYRLPQQASTQPAPAIAGQVIESGLLEELPADPNAEPIPTMVTTSPEVAAALEVAAESGEFLQLNLPSVLAMVDGQHPAVGLAQWRVQEAYARLDQARVLWLPSIRAGFSFNRHDGNLQASDGNIIDVNRNSFQYGLGAGAVGAGTSTVPGSRPSFTWLTQSFSPRLPDATLPPEAMPPRVSSMNN